MTAVRSLKVWFCIFYSLLASPALPAPGGASADLAPSDAILTMSLAIKENDPGQKWVFSELTKYFISEAGERGTPSRLDEIRLFHFSDFCFALFPPAAGDHEQMLIAAGLLPSGGTFGLTYGDQKFQLKVRDTKTATNTQTSLLTLLLGIACKVPADIPPDGGIYANPLRENKGKFAAFWVSDERALAATNKAIIKKALSGASRVTASRPYQETMALLPRGWDAYGYANNENAVLSRMLEAKKRGWQLFLLTLLAPAKRAGMALDVVDKDNSRIVLALAAAGPKEVKELRGKIEPTLNLLIAQCLDTRIGSTLRFEELPNALKIDAQLSHTSSYWERVFRKRAATPKPGPPAGNGNEPPA